MRKWIICIFVCLMGFLLIADGKVKANVCGGKGEICCQEDGKWTCDDDSLMCFQYGDEFKCSTKPSDSSLIGTCKCDSYSWFNSSKCKSIDNYNYCDTSRGEQAFCITNRDKECGPNIDVNLNNTCKCRTQTEASQDPELNGENKWREEGTCVFGILGGNYYVDFDYCESGQEARLYNVASIGYNVFCACVDKNLPKDAKAKQGGFYHKPLADHKQIERPIAGGESGINTKYLYGTNYKLYCEDVGSNEDPYIQTSLGCIPVTIKGFVAWLLPILFSIAGTVAFLIMVGGFIALATSEGDPKKMQAARETITAAVTGLLISIFSIFIVRLIIVYILKIPGA